MLPFVQNYDKNFPLKFTILFLFSDSQGDIEKNSLPIDLLYELTNKERVARESAEDLASIAELLVQKGLALRKR